MKQLNKDIADRSFKQMYLLVGEEIYLKLLYKKKMKDALTEAYGMMNVSLFSEDGVDEKSITDLGDTLPFLSEKRAIILENTGFFKNKCEKLPDYLNNMPDYLILIFVEKDIDKRSKMYKAVSKLGYVAEFKRQTDADLESWICQTVKKEGKVINSADAHFLLERIGNDMSNISTEMEKLICYNLKEEKISRESILEITNERVENKIFDMIKAVTEQKQHIALKMYTDLLTLKEPPLRILYLIARQYNILLLSLEMSKQKMSANDIAGQIGVQGFVVRNALPIARKYTPEFLRNAIEEVIDLETAVKSGKLSDVLSVELFIVKYSSVQSKKPYR